MTQESKRHHYLPQFYLRQWTSGPDNSVWRYKRIPSGPLHEKRVSTRQTGYGEKLYSAIDVASAPEHQQPDIIERKFFCPIDDAAAKIHQKLVTSPFEQLDDQERIAWARFLNSLLERDLPTLRVHDDRAGRIGEELLEETLARCPPENRSYFVDTLTSETMASLGKYVVRHRMISQIEDPEFLSYLAGHQWQVIQFEGAVELLTADLPLVINCKPERQYPIHMLSLALSPKHLFVSHPQSWALDEELFRTMIIVHSLALIFGNADTLYSYSRLEDGSQIRLRTVAENAFGLKGRNAGPDDGPTFEEDKVKEEGQ